jgi:hypothetical protein
MGRQKVGGGTYGQAATYFPVFAKTCRAEKKSGRRD